MFTRRVGAIALAIANLACASPLGQVDSALQPRQNYDLSKCPGYEASNIVKTRSSLTADLKLAGDACNVYSEDLRDLKLLVEYQTSMCPSNVKST